MPQSVSRVPAALLFVALVAAAACLWPGPANAQSFDCRAARSADESLICKESGLAQLDQELARRSGQLAKEQRDEFQQHEVFFLNARRRCGENSRCIEQSYRNRMRELEEIVSESDSGASKRTATSGERDPESQPDRRRRPSAGAPDGSGKRAAASKATTAETGTPESGQTATASISSTPQAAEQGRRSRKKTAATNPPPTPDNHPTERSGTTAPAAIRTPENPTKQSRPIAAAPREPPAAPSANTAAAGAPEPQASASGSSAKPSIQWVNPAPMR